MWSSPCGLVSGKAADFFERETGALGVENDLQGIDRMGRVVPVAVGMALSGDQTAGFVVANARGRQVHALGQFANFHSVLHRPELV